jgi:hypothetical protein
MNSFKKLIASVICAASLVGGVSITASAEKPSKVTSFDYKTSGTIITYGAGRW